MLAPQAAGSCVCCDTRTSAKVNWPLDPLTPSSSSRLPSNTASRSASSASSHSSLPLRPERSAPETAASACRAAMRWAGLGGRPSALCATSPATPAG